MQIWEEEGRPEGRALEHWLRAENELSAKLQQPNGATVAVARAEPEKQRTSRQRQR